jgi:hypothetical protein
MPLESGKLRLSPEELIGYRTAVDRLHESCQMTIDLQSPITTDEWVLLRLADCALKGEFSTPERIIARVQSEIEGRRKSH